MELLHLLGEDHWLTQPPASVLDPFQLFVEVKPGLWIQLTDAMSKQLEASLVEVLDAGFLRMSNDCLPCVIQDHLNLRLRLVQLAVALQQLILEYLEVDGDPRRQGDGADGLKDLPRYLCDTYLEQIGNSLLVGGWEDDEHGAPHDESGDCDEDLDLLGHVDEGDYQEEVVTYSVLAQEEVVFLVQAGLHELLGVSIIHREEVSEVN